MTSKIFSLLLLGLFIVSCNYSFTGSSLSPEIKTIKINRFPNFSSYMNPNYSQEFTNDLQLRFDQRTNLNLTNSDDADIKIEGEIIDYYETPTAITSNETAAQNRLTIKVKVRYINEVEEEKSFTKTFSAFEDFEGTQTIQQVESTLVPSINTRLIDQIFTAIVADW